MNNNDDTGSEKSNLIFTWLFPSVLLLTDNGQFGIRKGIIIMPKKHPFGALYFYKIQSNL
jgi:hypothetical protein